GWGSGRARPWFRRPFARRLDYCDDACAAERVQDRSDLDMRPCSAARRANIALVKLGGNSIVACYAASPDLLDDGANVGGEPPCICLQGRPAAFCNWRPSERL